MARWCGGQGRTDESPSFRAGGRQRVGRWNVDGVLPVGASPGQPGAGGADLGPSLDEIGADGQDRAPGGGGSARP
ncbi:MAG: hypothetical protein ACRD0U_14520, partial [Acidimicrobiales bacterium]